MELIDIKAEYIISQLYNIHINYYQHNSNIYIDNLMLVFLILHLMFIVEYLIYEYVQIFKIYEYIRIFNCG